MLKWFWQEKIIYTSANLKNKIDQNNYFGKLDFK